MSRASCSLLVLLSLGLLTPCVAGAQARATLLSTASPDYLSTEELELEIEELLSAPMVDLSMPGLVLGLGFAAGIVGSIVALVSAFPPTIITTSSSMWPRSTYFPRPEPRSEPEPGPEPDRTGIIIAGTTIAAAGGAALLVGLVWLFERLAPYEADAPRRDRVNALRRELRSRDREQRARERARRRR